MRQRESGFRRGGCGQVLDIAGELAAVEVPPEFDGPVFTVADVGAAA